MSKRELISKNYYLDEFTYSPTAVARKIDNTPNVEHVANLRHVVQNVIQPVRDNFKRALKINSGYRSPALNRAVGGSMNSQHASGEAVDFEIEGLSNRLVADWIAKHLNYDQLILEFYNPMEGVNSGWIHVSLRKTGINRKDRLVAYKDGKSTRYEKVPDFTKIK
jgi:hypothetical protein